MTQFSDHDREMARSMPDEFLILSGNPIDRLVEFVGRTWGTHDLGARAQLAQALLPIVLPLAECEVDVTDQQRDLCEAIVATWLARR